jgi:riboflavin synthase
MFTGIIEERGTVDTASERRLVVACATVVTDSPVGASVAVNGVCLTVVANTGDSLAFDLSEETLARTSLRRLRPADPVNLERPVTLIARLGGHIVQGHVDGVGAIEGVDPERGDARGALIRVSMPDDLMRYVVEKGSIAIDGISLTVAALDVERFTVAVIPYTLAATTLGTASPGDPVNLEVDVIAKYVAKYVKSLMEGQRV